LEVFRFSPSNGCPTTAPCLALTQAMRSRCVSSASKIPDCVVAHRSDRYPPVRPVRPTGQTGLELLQHCLRFFGLGFVDQPRNPVVFWRTTGNPANLVKPLPIATHDSAPT
jgi:hypothetical protein